MMEQRVHKEFKESKVQPARKVFKGMMALLVHKVYKVLQVQKVPLAMMVPPVHKASRVCKE
jgi:hypothetical protein